MVEHPQFRDLEMLVGGGSLTYCDFDECHIAAQKIFSYANGIVKGKEGHYYVWILLSLFYPGNHSMSEHSWDIHDTMSKFSL